MHCQSCFDFFLVELPRCKKQLFQKCWFCMCSFLFPLLRFSSKRRTYCIHADKAETCFAKQVSWSVFCGSLQFFVWPAIWHLFHHRPVDLERFPPPGASQTFIAHASVEAKSRAGESSDNHKNNSSKLSEDVFLWTELATVGKTTIWIYYGYMIFVLLLLSPFFEGVCSDVLMDDFKQTVVRFHGMLIRCWFVHPESFWRYLYDPFHGIQVQLKKLPTLTNKKSIMSCHLDIHLSIYIYINHCMDPNGYTP